MLTPPPTLKLLSMRQNKGKGKKIIILFAVGLLPFEVAIVPSHPSHTTTPKLPSVARGVPTIASVISKDKRLGDHRRCIVHVVPRPFHLLGVSRCCLLAHFLALLICTMHRYLGTYPGT